MQKSRKYPSSTGKRENDALTASWRANNKNRYRSRLLFVLEEILNRDTRRPQKEGKKEIKRAGHWQQKSNKWPANPAFLRY